MKQCLFALAAVCITVVAVPLLAAAPAGAETVVWTPGGGCGSLQTTTAPAGATTMTVNIAGGKGGSAQGQGGGPGGGGANGGQLVATIAVAPGQTVTAVIGCNGKNGADVSENVATAGWSTGGGGALGWTTLFNRGGRAGAGGGASAVCTSATCSPTSGTVVAVAGGGGGGGVGNCDGTSTGSGGLGGNGSSSVGGGGSGPSGNNGSNGGNTGNNTNGGAGGAGGVNSAGGSANGATNSDPAQDAGGGLSVAGGGGGGGKVGGKAGANASFGCKGAGGGGGGSSWAVTGATGLSSGNATTGAVQVTFTIADTAPGAPTIGMATAGNGQATLTWTAPVSDGGSPVTGYVVTPYIGASAQSAQTFNTTATTQNVLGLTNGTAYTFRVAAKNAVGTGIQSGNSNAVTPATVPGAPTIGTAVGGNGFADVSWTAPASNGSSTLTGYEVIPFIGGVAQPSRLFDATTTSRRITGLSNGSTYTFKVKASNGVGTGLPSAASNAVTLAVYAPFLSLDDFIDQQYLDFADRLPTTAERAAATALLTSGDETPEEFIDSLRTAPYFEPVLAQVVRLYSAYFLRRPDTGGLSFWIAKRRGGTDLADISQYFSKSPEFKTRYGSLSDADFVVLVYTNVLGRSPDATGLAFWVGRLAGGMSRGRVMIGFSNSTEYANKMANTVSVTTIYYGMLRRVPSESELSGGTTVLSGGGDATDIINQILTGTEYRTRVLA